MDHHFHRARASYDSWCWVSNGLLWSKSYLLMRNSFFYSGLARRKSALSLIWLSLMATALISFQWFFWGYSLAFSHTAGKYIGDLENIGFRNVLAAPSVGSPKVPDLLYAVYQGMFAAITCVYSGYIIKSGNTDLLLASHSPLAPSPNVEGFCHASSSCGSGRRLYMTPLPAGRGTPTDGDSS